MIYKSRDIAPSNEPVNVAAIHSVARDRYAWPGGYPLIAMVDGDILCADCVRENYRNILADTFRDGWGTWKVTWTGCTQFDEHELLCGHCGAVIVECWRRDETEDCPEGCSRAEATV